MKLQCLDNISACDVKIKFCPDISSGYFVKVIVSTEACANLLLTFTFEILTPYQSRAIIISVQFLAIFPKIFMVLRWLVYWLIRGKLLEDLSKPFF